MTAHAPMRTDEAALSGYRRPRHPTSVPFFKRLPLFMTSTSGVSRVAFSRVGINLLASRIQAGRCTRASAKRTGSTRQARDLVAEMGPRLRPGSVASATSLTDRVHRVDHRPAAMQIDPDMTAIHRGLPSSTEELVGEAPSLNNSDRTGSADPLLQGISHGVARRS
jgi:hypothetical protein